MPVTGDLMIATLPTNAADALNLNLARHWVTERLARRLVLTEGTVANHVRAMLIRLGVRSRAQVAVWHVERGR